MEPITNKRNPAGPDGLPVVATIEGADSQGVPVCGMVTQSHSGRVFYIAVWATAPRNFRGAWKTRDRAEVDWAIDTLRREGFAVTEY